MENVVLTIHLILALLLVGVVLLQRSEGGGLGMGSSGGGGGAMSSRGAANVMTKLTWLFATAFIITSLTLYVLAANRSGGLSVVDQVTTEAPAGETAPAPSLGDLTVPPPAADEPVAPPAAD